MTEPPVIRHLNFGRYHPLDHVIATRRCRAHYGGPRHHASLWWEFRGQPLLARHVRCRFGRHEPVDAWQRGERFTVCLYCDEELDP